MIDITEIKVMPAWSLKVRSNLETQCQTLATVFTFQSSFPAERSSDRRFNYRDVQKPIIINKLEHETAKLRRSTGGLLWQADCVDMSVLG
jgi:hypothetical protein